MAFSGTQYGDISPRVGIFAVTKMLAYADSQLVLEKWAEVQPLPKNKGLTIKWRRPIPFDVIDTQLTEGVTPAPQILQYEDVTATIAQYGAWVPFTDVIQDTHEDPNLSVITELCAKQAADTKEAIIWGVIRAGTNVYYSGSATTRATVTAPIVLDDIVAGVRELKANHAHKITKVLKASSNIATEPVNASFVAVSHVNMEADFRNMDSFVPVEKYASFSPICDQEIGKVNEVRIILTPHLEPFFGAGSATTTGVLNNGANVDVYVTLVIAEGAYAVTPLRGMESVAMGVKNPKMADSYEDPLGQRGFVSWKMWYVAKILNDAWMVRIESACSAF